MQAIDDPVILDALKRDVGSVLTVLHAASPHASDDRLKDLLTRQIADIEAMSAAMQHRLDVLANDHSHLPETMGPHSLRDGELETHLGQLHAMMLSDHMAAAQHIRTTQDHLLKLFRKALTQHLTLETYAMLTDFLAILEHQPTSESA